jgi:ATP-dependent Zn protease
MSIRAKTIVFWTIFVVTAVVLLLVTSTRPRPLSATYSQFLSQVASGEVLKATINNADSGANPVEYHLKNGARLQSVLPSDYREAMDAMQQKLVNIEIADGPHWPRFVANSAPFLILLGFWVFAYGQLKHRGGR